MHTFIHSLHYITLHYIALHCVTLRYSTLHYITYITYTTYILYVYMYMYIYIFKHKHHVLWDRFDHPKSHTADQRGLGGQIRVPVALWMPIAVKSAFPCGTGNG